MNILSVASQMFVHWPQQVMVALGCENKLYELRRGQSAIPTLKLSNMSMVVHMLKVPDYNFYFHKS